VIEPDVNIGEGTVIMNNVIISKNVKIGKFCFIKSGSIIGEDGFGFDFDNDRVPIRLPHLGSVIIEDNVEIGSVNTIQKGTIDNTIINSNTKLSDHVHVAHNCIIGKNCIISAHAQICGSVKIGNNCWIGANSSIIQNVEIKNNVTIGIGTIIINNVNENFKIMGFEGLELNSLRKIKKKLKYGKY
jgi:UDP-3-O-[3-hydroxymyristoyl] glucosamine N-acyltransferase